MLAPAAKRSALRLSSRFRLRMVSCAKIELIRSTYQSIKLAMSRLLGTTQNDPPRTKRTKNKKIHKKEIQKSLLNLRFKGPQSRGPLQDDRKYIKIRACKIWWVAVQYTSSSSPELVHHQNSFFRSSPELLLVITRNYASGSPAPSQGLPR